MLNNLGLGLIFTAKDAASPAMARVGRNFRSLDQQITSGRDRMLGAFRDLGLGVAAFAAGAKGLKGLFGLAETAGEFEYGMSAVSAVTRATSRELAMLEQAAVEAGIATEFSPDEAVKGLQALATAGQTARQSVKTLKPVLDLAAGSMGQLTVEESAQAVVGTLNAYRLGAEDAVEVTDRLLRITQLTNFQTRDFGVGLSKAAAVSRISRAG